MLYKERLSVEEENKYIEKLSMGDISARNKLIEHNLRLVSYIAQKFNNTILNLDELINIGTIGLINGIDSYNKERGVKLSTYISKCIENQILVALRKEKSGIPASKKISLNAPATIEDNTYYLENFIADDYNLDEVCINNNYNEIINYVLYLLSDKESKLLIYYFFQEKNQEQISKKMNVSQSYISRKLKQIYKKIKPYFDAEELTEIEKQKLKDAKTKILSKSFNI